MATVGHFCGRGGLGCTIGGSDVRCGNGGCRFNGMAEVMTDTSGDEKKKSFCFLLSFCSRTKSNNEIMKHVLKLR